MSNHENNTHPMFAAALNEWHRGELPGHVERVPCAQQISYDGKTIGNKPAGANFLEE
jgi:hypothetical protein